EHLMLRLPSSLCLGAILALAVCGSEAAYGVTLTIVPHMHGDLPADSPTARYTVRGIRTTTKPDNLMPATQATGGLDESVSVPLPAGQWSLDAEVPGSWHA